MKVLILGGYGVFGGRLVQLLHDIDGLHLIVAGRSLARAQASCAHHRGKTRVEPLALDRANTREALRTHRPNLVVDASGPFQHYQANPYGVIEACIAAGADYLDLADAADFVAGVSKFDEAAKAAGVAVLSGVSTFPVLTAAVLRKLAPGLDIHAVEAGIAPSPYAGIGLNVMRAVLGYAGAPVKLLRGGRPSTAYGLTESRRFTVAMPGRLPLRNLRFSLVDVPDLQVLPPEFPSMTDIWIGAGPVPESLHRMLNLLAKAKARLGRPALTPFAGLFYAVLNRMRFGEHRGGMYVAIRGRAEGRDVRRSWHLLAEGDDGPMIPSMAAEILIRKRLGGNRPAPGARPATHALELDDYAAAFAPRAITFGVRDDTTPGTLYQHILGPAFATLPPRLRELHGTSAPRQWTGSATVRRGTSPAARLLCALIGFPAPAKTAAVTVTFTPTPGGEQWTRTIGGKTFKSLQSAGNGRNQYLLVETFGAAKVSLALVQDGTRLLFTPRRWTLLGLPMPARLLPTGQSFETELDGNFAFDITIHMPLAGLVIAYRGTLQPAPTTHPAATPQLEPTSEASPSKLPNAAKPQMPQQIAEGSTHA